MKKKYSVTFEMSAQAKAAAVRALRVESSDMWAIAQNTADADAHEEFIASAYELEALADALQKAEGEV